MAKSPTNPEKIRKGVESLFRDAGIRGVTVYAPAGNGRGGQPVNVSFAMTNGTRGVVTLENGRVPDKPNLRSRLIEKSMRAAAPVAGR